MRSGVLPIILSVLMGVPRTVFSYPGYVAAPLLSIRWTSTSTLIKLALLVSGLGLAAALNGLLGTDVSPLAWFLELLLILPFLLAVFGFPTVRTFDGRQLIRAMNVVALAMSMVTLFQNGFPFQLPYIHYLPDVYDGSYGPGGAKIVTIIGFFGLAECLSRPAEKKLSNMAILATAAANFIVPNFILGIVAGTCGLAIYARKHRSLILVGTAVAFVVAPYIAFRAETKNNDFAEYYGYNPKIYAVKVVADVYVDHPQTVLIGAGLGQFASEAAIWASPASRIVGDNRASQLSFLTSSDVHREHMAPLILRFQSNRYAIESSSNKPFSGISIMLVELGLPLTVLIIYLFYVRFWKRSPNDFGRAAFVFSLAINLLDPQIDSPWFGILLIGALAALRADRRALAYRHKFGDHRERGTVWKIQQSA